MKSPFFPLRFNTLLLSVGLFLVGSLNLQSCMAPFDAIGSENVSNLSAKLPALMSKATEPFKSHDAEATTLQSDLSKAVTHAGTMKKNKEVAEAWKILQNDLVVPFITRWKEKGKLDKDFVKEATMQVSKSLDAIKKAESAKKK